MSPAELDALEARLRTFTAKAEAALPNDDCECVDDAIRAIAALRRDVDTLCFDYGMLKENHDGLLAERDALRRGPVSAEELELMALELAARYCCNCPEDWDEPTHVDGCGGPVAASEIHGFLRSRLSSHREAK